MGSRCRRDEAAGIKVLPNHSIHHKVPISVAEKDPLVNMARGLGYDINNANNLKQLPRDSAARSAPGSARLPEHGPGNYHPAWIRHSREVLQEQLRELRKQFSVPANLNPQQAVDYLVRNGHGDEILNAVKRVEQGLGRDLINPPQGAKWIKFNDKGERVLARSVER